MNKSFKYFFLISLGCAKNSIDSHSMAELLKRRGMEELTDSHHADVIIVNTCGFISPAREESLQILRETASRKSKGQVLIAAGCLSEREKEQLFKEVPNLDAILGTRRWMDIGSVLKELEQNKKKQYIHLIDYATVGRDEQGTLRAAIQGGSAYLKIGDGCDRPCSFCAIPIIKGPAISRPMKDVLTDAIRLQEKGVKELILISQDTTSYGHDLKMKDGLVRLLREIIRSVPKIPWLRILYTFPGAITRTLIQTMAEQEQVLHYVDLPLQHAHPSVLRRMQRPMDIEWIRKTIANLRKAMPDLALRTTFIVGFPGETEQEFQTLVNFIKEIQFDRVGFFPFYAEAGTSAFSLDDSVPINLKEERLQYLAAIQEKISLSRNQQFMHKTLEILVEGVDKDVVVGRSYRDAPEIDGLVIGVGRAEIGEIVSVKIEQAMVHDLVGKIAVP